MLTARGWWLLLIVLAMVALGGVLVTPERHGSQMLLLLGLALLVIAIDDASFIGGMRPFGCATIAI